MKQKRLFYVIGIVLILAMSTVACAKKSDSSNMDMGTDTTAVAPEEANSVAMDRESDMGFTNSNTEVPKKDVGEAAGTTGNANSTSYTLKEVSTQQNNDKIIRSFYLNVETQSFDSLITKIDSEIKRLGGYVEGSQISGKSIFDSEGARHADYTARIPKEHLDEFVNIVGENANVINKQESTENVSLQYADIESRKKALEIEQERLFKLLEKTDSLDSIVILEKRLSEIRYELQNYETTLLTYDNKVEYSTVTLGVQEVKKLTPTTEIKQSVGTRIANGFGNTMYNLSEGLKNFIVWFVVNLPYLIIWAVFIFIAFLIVKMVRRKIDKIEKNNSSQPPTPPAPPMN